MSETLKHKTVKGVVWTSVDRFANQGVSFVFSIVLARLLSPSDYGIIAMTAIFFSVAGCFIDSGFGSALIRKKDRTEEDLYTCFFFNVVVSIACYMLLFLCAPLIAKFYNQPILTAIIRISGLNLVIGAFAGVSGAMFSYKLDFKTPAIISLICNIVSGLVGVIVAYLGYGIWALVWQGVASGTLRSLLTIVASKFHPKFAFSKKSFHYLFSYGSKLTLSYLIGTLYENIYPIFIGKFYKPSQLGNYARALGWAQLPSSNITGVIQKVTFPVLAEIQDDSQRLAFNYRRLLRLSAFVVFPLMVGLSAVASPLIRVVLTSKWDGCIIYLQIVCFALMWYPIHAINLNLLEVKGRSDLFLRLEIIKKIVGLCIMFVAIPLGVEAMCWSMIVSSIICLFINTYYTGKIIHVSFWMQMKDILPIFLNSCLMGIIVYACISFLSMEALKLVVGILVGAVYYILSSYFISKQEFKDLKDII